MPPKENTKTRRQKRQINDVEYVSSAEATSTLGVRRETLYTYVSRGLIKTVQRPGVKAKLYRKADVEKLRSRAVARSGGPQVSHALRYGEPIAQTWISEITAQGPRYRGVLARDLVRDGRSFEFASELIWTGLARTRDIAWPALQETRPLEHLIKLASHPADRVTPLKLLTLLTTSLSAFEQAEGDIQAAGLATYWRLLQTLAGAAGVFGPDARFSAPREGEFVAQCIARGLGLGDRVDAVQAIDAALVMSAEHELSAPSFAARICASTGADLHACVATAMLTQSGAMQVGGAVEVEALIDALPSRLDPEDALSLAAAMGLTSYGPDTPKIRALVVGARQAGQHPNVFAALVMLCKAMGLPNGTGAMLHTLARTTGWIAHALEQRLTGAMLRPRARYMGQQGSS
jgi:citrate synthase